MSSAARISSGSMSGAVLAEGIVSFSFSVLPVPGSTSMNMSLRPVLVRSSAVASRLT